MEDYQAYRKYPQHHKWFNKLYVAELFGYHCGPCGTAPSKTGTYVVRPIYNLAGMGVGARVQRIEQNDLTAVEPGYFWCEYLTGKHYSANYKWEWDRDRINGKWIGQSCWVGSNLPVNLTKFIEWQRSYYIPELPSQLSCLHDVDEINVEFKGNDIIEVHLRTSPDPEYNSIIPIWKSDNESKIDHYVKDYGYQFIPAEDDADGFLDDPRIGFLVK